VTALATDDASGSVGGPLLALVRKQLIRPDGSGLDGDDAFRFRHIIIRDVAYERMPKSDRAELHERFAEWLQGVLGDRVSEYVEIVAYHLAEALTYRIELDTLDGPGGLALAEQAVARLVEAAERADGLHAYAQAARLWAKAALVARTPTFANAHLNARHDPIEFERRAADADVFAGNLEAGVDRMRRLIGELGDVDPVGRGRLLERLAAYLWEYGDEPGTLAAIQEAVRLVPAYPPSRDRARVLAGHARFLMLLRRSDESLPVCKEALQAAAAIGSSVDRVSALTTLGVSLGHLGHADEAVALIEEARDLANDIGDGKGFVRAESNLGVVFGLAGDRTREQEATRRAIARLADLGLERSPNGLGTRLNYANGLIYEGDFDEADLAIGRVLELEPSGDTAVRAMILQGYVLASRGRHADARAVFSAARARAQRGMQRTIRLDLLLSEAFNAIQDRRVDDAIGLVEEGRRSANDEPDYRLEFAVYSLRVAAERAVQARIAGDDTLERRWISEARQRGQWIAEFVRSDPVLSRTARHSLPLVAPELSRAEGRPMPGAWQAAVEQLVEMGFPWDAAYASYRRAESLVENGADLVDVVAALDEADAAAGAVGAEGLARWVEELREATRRNR
jgi:tetratricopeptide (TPR) repeat protein